MQSLAVKYRPKEFTDVVCQEAVKTILEYQIKTKTWKSAYLFEGSAGTGKTTCARIFARKINNDKGNPIELDAASNNGVDSIREIIKQARTKSIDTEYKVIIIDEAHSISLAGFQAFLKCLEEPPEKTVFILCTTNPEKIPKTILSRVQRFTFQRISQEGIKERLCEIVKGEGLQQTKDSDEVADYISKIANGGMRDAIQLLDKCISYSDELSIKNAIAALGNADYNTLCDLLIDLLDRKLDSAIKIIDDVYYSGKDLKQFIYQFMQFIVDVLKYYICKDEKYITIPVYCIDALGMDESDFELCKNLLSTIINLNADIKWITNPKSMIEATLLLF